RAVTRSRRVGRLTRSAVERLPSAKQLAGRGTMATIVSRISGGTGVPFNSVAGEVEGVGGVEDEVLFEGTTTQFGVRGGGAYATDGRWAAEPMSDKPFRSRLLVVRPGNLAAFNGTVIVTWNNVSAGQDNFTVGQSAAQLLADGFALVGVTTQ